MSFHKYLNPILIWRVRHVKPRQFILFLSFVVGILGGLVAILLKNIVHFTHVFLTEGFDVKYSNYLYFAYPLIGILLTVLYIKFFVKENISHGITKILYAISRKNSVLNRHNNYSSMVSSTLTVGFGGSVGLEAPIVLTGSAIGSTLGRVLRLNYKTKTLLIGCGAAAAIAGIFKAPIAAVLFAIEVLMLDLTTWSMVPLLISAVTGAAVANFLLGNGVVFYFTIKDPLQMENIGFYILLGIITGFVSIYFMKTTRIIENQFDRIKNIFTKVFVGGLILGIIIYFFPPLFGEGFFALKSILGGNASELVNNSLFFNIKTDFWLFSLFLLALIFLKVVAMAITTGSGGIGGVFAPSLFVGGVLGYLFTQVLNRFNFIHLSESNFSLVAMSGMIAGVMGAPLTAIFLIAEITGGYQLFIPLIITATTSFMVAMYFEKHSIYTKRLAKSGALITHNKDKAVLTLMKLDKLIEKDLKTVSPNANLGELVEIISHSSRNIFPVLDVDGSLLGIVSLDSIRSVIFNSDLYETMKVAEIMAMPPAFVSSKESMESVMKKFEETGAWNLPVIDNNKYVGFLSKSKIFSSYRKMLINFSDE